MPAKVGSYSLFVENYYCYYYYKGLHFGCTYTYSNYYPIVFLLVNYYLVICIFMFLLLLGPEHRVV